MAASLFETASWLCVTITGPQFSKLVAVVRAAGCPVCETACVDYDTGGFATLWGRMIGMGVHRRLCEDAGHGWASEWVVTGPTAVGLSLSRCTLGVVGQRVLGARLCLLRAARPGLCHCAVAGCRYHVASPSRVSVGCVGVAKSTGGLLARVCACACVRAHAPSSGRVPVCVAAAPGGTSPVVPRV